MILIIVLSNLDAQVIRVGLFNRYGPKLANVKCSCCTHSGGQHKNHYYKDYYKPKLKNLIPSITIPTIVLPSIPKLPKLKWRLNISFEPYDYSDVLNNPQYYFPVTNKEDKELPNG
jgi:hypothetical protein